MKKKQLQRTAEQSLYTTNQLLKLALTFIPNGQLIDSFINFNSGLKQERILGFAEDIKRIFEKELGKSLENYNFETEDFVDLYDSIMRRVQSTKSDQKLNAFKGIFVNAIINDSYDLTQVYIDLTSSLHEKQIEILNLFIKTDDNRKNKSKEITQLSKESEQKELYRKELEELSKNGTLRHDQSLSKAGKEERAVKAKLERTRNAHKQIVDSINPECFNLEDSHYNFFLRDLISKGLLQENTYVSFSTPVVDSIDATNFALDYYSFVTIHN